MTKRSPLIIALDDLALGGEEPHVEAQLLAVMSHPNIAFQLNAEEAARMEQRALDLATAHGFKDVAALLVYADAWMLYLAGDFERAATLYRMHTRGSMDSARSETPPWPDNTGPSASS